MANNIALMGLGYFLIGIIYAIFIPSERFFKGGLIFFWVLDLLLKAGAKEEGWLYTISILILFFGTVVFIGASLSLVIQIEITRSPGFTEALF